MRNLLTGLESYILSNRWLLLILIVTFLIRIPSLFEPLWYGDEAIYLTIGQKLLGGATMYADVFDHKTPGIYYLTAAIIGSLGETVWSIKFVLLIWVLTTLVFFYILTNKLFDKKVAFVSTATFSILTSFTFIEGNIFNSEILMILPTIIGILAGLNKRYLLSGIFFSLAFLFKVPAVFDFAAFFVFIGLAVQKKSLPASLRNLASITLGFLIPITFTIVYFLLNGALSAYIRSAFLFNISYTGVGNYLFIPNGLLILKAVPVILVISYFFFRIYQNLKISGKVTPNVYEFLVIWLILSFYAASFGGRSYEHYLIQVVPSFSLIIGSSLFDKTFRKIGFALIGIIIVLVILLEFRPWFKPSYYVNYAHLALGNMTFDAYANSFDPKVARNYAVAAFLTGCESFDRANKCLQTRTGSFDKLYVYADHSSIYFLSGLEPASSYVVYFHIENNPIAQKETLDDIRQSQPKYIIADKNLTGGLPSLEKLLARDYNLFALYENLAIYKIKDPTDSIPRELGF